MSVKKTITIREMDAEYLEKHPELCLSRLVQSAIDSHKQIMKRGQHHDAQSQ